MSYQNIPGISQKFERDCQERWELIKSELPIEGVVLDIGAAEGFFLKKIAEQTQLLAVGVEKNKARIAFQCRWLSDSYQGKVISCFHAFDTAFSNRLVQTPEWIDVTLLLSILHWINSDEFLKNVASMSGKVIVEIPDLDDRKATGQKFMDRIRQYGNEQSYLSHITDREIRLLGKVKAHTFPTRNIWVIEGNMERRPDIPHINFNGKSRTTYYQKFTNGQLIYKKNDRQIDWIPGINLVTLANMDIVFPVQKWWNEEIRKSFNAFNLQAQKDMRIHNLIVSRDKLNWVDLNHHGHRNSILDEIKGMVKDIV